jgi:L,D-peptidoglycan transpeptidase YkuD (ErfK/YbiS/YcfS/YnhG family)
MSFGRFAITSAAVVVAGGCAVVVVGMASASPGTHRHVADRGVADVAPLSSIPAQKPGAAPAESPAAHRATRIPPAAPTSSTSTATTPAATHTSPPVSSSTPAPSTSALSTTAAPAPHTATAAPARTTASAPPHTAAAAPAPTHTSTHPAPAASTSAAHPRHAAKAPRHGVRLPVSGFIGRAHRVITVRASSTSSTTATLRTWHKAAGGGWIQVGRGVTAHIGADGMSRSASESRSATPIGSFTLTQAFGAYGNPGTHLHYFRSNAADWWISQSGPLYNTHQRCWSGCRFNQGSPNEHLRYETPYYNYAVVIDYNTRNSPTGVRQGRGSAFFLHVHPAGTGATAGCVSIPQSRLVTIMKWLTPSTHPRILIGTG